MSCLTDTHRTANSGPWRDMAMRRDGAVMINRHPCIYERVGADNCTGLHNGTSHDLSTFSELHVRLDNRSGVYKSCKSETSVLEANENSTAPIGYRCRTDGIDQDETGWILFDYPVIVVDVRRTFDLRFGKRWIRDRKANNRELLQTCANRNGVSAGAKNYGPQRLCAHTAIEGVFCELHRFISNRSSLPVDHRRRVVPGEQERVKKAQG